MLSGAYIQNRSGERGVQKRRANMKLRKKWRLQKMAARVLETLPDRALGLKPLAHAIGLEQQSTRFAETA